jgi:folate-binding protein YgfZ
VSQERRPPLEATYRGLGAEWRGVEGCLLPERFGAVVEEVRAVRQAAGVIDRSDCAYLEATGADAVRFLHGMVSNEVKELAAGQGRYALQLDAQGHILADLHLLVLADHLLLETAWALKVKLRATLERYIIADDLELSDLSDQLSALAVEGPAAAKLLGAAGVASLPRNEFDHVESSLGGAPVRVVRLSETGEEGYRLIFAVEYAQNVWEALAAQQAAMGWKPVGHAALNLLRLEAGRPRYGVDMDERTLPQEAGLEARAISYTKGCYIGQETVERIHSRGHVNRKLVGLLLAGDAPPAPGAKLSAEGKEVGWVTSAAHSPTLGRPIALGYVRREYLGPGTRVGLEGGLRGEIVALPFYTRP